MSADKEEYVPGDNAELPPKKRSRKPPNPQHLPHADSALPGASNPLDAEMDEVSAAAGAVVNGGLTVRPAECKIRLPLGVYEATKAVQYDPLIHYLPVPGKSSRTIPWSERDKALSEFASSTMTGRMFDLHKVDACVRGYCPLSHNKHGEPLLPPHKPNPHIFQPLDQRIRDAAEKAGQTPEQYLDALLGGAWEKICQHVQSKKSNATIDGPFEDFPVILPWMHKQILQFLCPRVNEYLEMQPDTEKSGPKALLSLTLLKFLREYKSACGQTHKEMGIQKRRAVEASGAKALHTALEAHAETVDTWLIELHKILGATEEELKTAEILMPDLHPKIERLIALVDMHGSRSNAVDGTALETVNVNAIHELYAGAEAKSDEDDEEAMQEVSHHCMGCQSTRWTVFYCSKQGCEQPVCGACVTICGWSTANTVAKEQEVYCHKHSTNLQRKALTGARKRTRPPKDPASEAAAAAAAAGPECGATGGACKVQTLQLQNQELQLQNQELQRQLEAARTTIASQDQLLRQPVVPAPILPALPLFQADAAAMVVLNDPLFEVAPEACLRCKQPDALKVVKLCGTCHATCLHYKLRPANGGSNGAAAGGRHAGGGRHTAAGSAAGGSAAPEDLEDFSDL